jgi:hypothetical protein
LPTLAGNNISIAANGQISAIMASGGGGGGNTIIIGGAAIQSSQTFQGGNQVYSLVNPVDSANVLMVTINGLSQIPTIDYNVTGSTLTFSGNTPGNALIEVKALGYSGLTTNVFSIANSITIPTLTTQLSYMMTANVTAPESILVSLNGIMQRPRTDYTVNNTTLTFASAPPNGNVEIRFFGQEAFARATAAANITAYISNSRTYVGGNLYYDLGSNVALARNIIVTLDGLTLIPDTDYTVNGSNLTLIGGSSTNSSLEVKFFGAEAYNPVFTTSIVTAALGSGIAGNILPSANMVYNLGSPTRRWKDLYLAGNTIDIDGVTIKNDGGTIKFTDVNGTTSASSAAKAIGYSLIFGG